MSTDDPYTAPPAPSQPSQSPADFGAAPFSAAPLPPIPFVPSQQPTLPAKGFATAAIALTGAYTALALVGALLVKTTLKETKEALANPETASPFGSATSSALNGLSSMVGIAAFVFLALWMMRIRKNLAAVGTPAGGPPSVEWWGWFVPIANFVLPLLGMRAISRRSVGWGLLLGWWLPFCVVWAILPVVAFTPFRAIDLSSGKLENPDLLDSMVPFTYASTAALVLSWLFLVIVIRRTTARHLAAAAA